MGLRAAGLPAGGRRRASRAKGSAGAWWRGASRAARTAASRSFRLGASGRFSTSRRQPKRCSSSPASSTMAIESSPYLARGTSARSRSGRVRSTAAAAWASASRLGVVAHAGARTSRIGCGRDARAPSKSKSEGLARIGRSQLLCHWLSEARLPCRKASRQASAAHFAAGGLEQLAGLEQDDRCDRHFVLEGDLFAQALRSARGLLRRGRPRETVDATSATSTTASPASVSTAKAAEPAALSFGSPRSRQSSRSCG